jgi:hypothetical protein
MNVKPTIFAAACFLVTSFCVGCYIREQRDVDAVRRALESVLIYVGEAPDRPSPEVGDHGLAKLPFPERLLKGRQYIFHRRSAPEESWIEIEKALRANGAQIIDAPRGNVGLGFAFVGGPFFVIEFRMGQLHCSFQNRMAKELGSGGLSEAMQQEDFVLRIE